MFCFKNYKTILVLLIFTAGLFTLESCNKDDSHPITWKFWIDKSKSKLLKFNRDGSVRDLYNLSGTSKDIFEADSKGLVIYRKTVGKRDTLSAEIVYLEGDLLILKYRNSSKPDTLHSASNYDAITGRWIPSFDESQKDTFEFMQRDIFDSYRISADNIKEYYRYKLLNDSLMEVNFFEKNQIEKCKYVLSRDKQLLLLTLNKRTISLQRK